MEFNSATYQLVENGELEYADSSKWKTFEAFFTCQSKPGLKYMVIGNFSQRIPMSDIGLTPGATFPNDTNNISFPFYFYIDDVEVRAIGNDTCTCNGTSIFTCPHTRSDSLQAHYPDKCCFTTPIRPSSVACDFRFVRIKAGGVTVSKPPIIDYGGIVATDSTVHASFCTDARTDDMPTIITIEFLREDSSVACSKTDYAYCNCPCSMASDRLAPGASKKVLEDDFVKTDGDTSGNCCWEFSLKNNHSCNFQDTSFVVQIDPYGLSVTAISPWLSSILSSHTMAFTLPGGLKYNSISKVFRVCTTPQSGSTHPPVLKVDVYHEPTTIGGSPCASFGRYTLECRADTNCCDLLDIELRRKSQTAYHECTFDLIVRHKNAKAKCNVYRIRVRDTSGTELHITDSTGTPLNLDKSTVIWSGDLGAECPWSLTAGFGKKAAYVIEILDSLGNVKCSVRDTFKCCYSGGHMPPMDKDAVEEEEIPVELPTGGTITNAYIEDKKLQYAINNKSAATHATLRIVGMKGEVIMNFEGDLKSGMNAGELDISRLASGAYYFVVQTPNWQTSRQIMITR